MKVYFTLLSEEAEIMIEDFTGQVRKLNFTYSYFRILGTISYGIIGTFIVLLLLDFLNFIEVGILLGIGMAIQAITDYPTGALGDYIGQKNVLIIAHLFHAAAAITFILATTFPQFLLSVCLAYLGLSQESGALQTWYDNSYRYYAKELDPDRTKYGSFMGSLNLGTKALGAAMIIASGIIAELFSRKTLFLLQLVSLLIAIVSFPILLNKPPTEEKQTTRLSYTKILSTGVDFVKRSKGNAAIFIGIALLMGTISGIWGNLIIFPLYSSYAKTDSLTALLRFITWVVGIVVGAIVIRPSKRIKDARKALYRTMIPSSVGLFLCVTLFFLILPPTQEFDLFRFLGLAAAFNVFSVFTNLQEILQVRFILDFVPDQTRNALYSLISTFAMIIAVPSSIFGGIIIQLAGIQTGMITVTIIQFFGALIIMAGLHWIQKDPEYKGKVDTSEKSETTQTIPF